MFTRTETPDKEEYVLMKAKSSLSAQVKLSQAYAIKPGELYLVELVTAVQYYHANDYHGIIEQNLLMQHLQTKPSLLQHTGVQIETEGEYYRKLVPISDEQVGQQSSSVKKPVIRSPSIAVNKLMAQIHIAAYHFVKGSKKDISLGSNKHFKRWFGNSKKQEISSMYDKVISALKKDIFTFKFFGVRCSTNRGLFAYTWGGSRTIVFCDRFLRLSNVSTNLGNSYRAKVGIYIHELMHAVNRHVDVTYRRECSKQLAKENPSCAACNADNYRAFSDTTNIFKYGHDAATLFPNGKLYVTKGNMFICYNNGKIDSKINSNYPKLIYEKWEDLPENFLEGFDSIAMLPNRRVYVTKGNEYVRLTGSSMDSGYPKKLKKGWGKLPESFAKGFDSMSTLPNGKTYVTKGNQYIRYSDRNAMKIDFGYPKPLHIYWGLLPVKFRSSFDSMVLTRDGKTYVTKGRHYIRYSDLSGSIVDTGYPKEIKSNWGGISSS